MKSTLLSLFSALILTHGVSAHAEGIFFNPFGGKNEQPAAASTQFATYEPAIESQVKPKQQAKAGSNIQLASFCESGCATGCDNGCDSWFSQKMCPGTGAYGGDSRFSAFLGFNQDTFFGNYTTASAGYAVNEFVDVTVYSILWHTEFFSQNGLGGNQPLAAAADQIPGTGLWTEFGGGLNFKLMDGALNVNPQLGILNGALLSSAGALNDPAVFDGIVPNLTVNYADDRIESQLYLGYYIGTRGPADQNDYVHWWYNAGIKPWGDSNTWKSAISTGLHYEMLAQTDGAGPNFDSFNLYQWFGPYMQFSLPNGFSARYSFGRNVDDNLGLGDNFYKVNLGYSF